MFADSLGNSVKGRSRMREGWRGYFTMFSDYEVSVSEIFQKGIRFAPFGAARGTYANGKLLRGNRMEGPCGLEGRCRGETSLRVASIRGQVQNGVSSEETS